MNRKRIIPFRFHGYVEFENVSKAAVNTTHSALRRTQRCQSLTRCTSNFGQSCEIQSVALLLPC